MADILIGAHTDIPRGRFRFVTKDDQAYNWKAEPPCVGKQFGQYVAQFVSINRMNLKSLVFNPRDIEHAKTELAKLQGATFLNPS